jgi:8-oxo-dGTP diphosphatase
MKFQFSAGGIVYRKEGNQTMILVSKHSQHHGWVFPKGLIGDHIEGEKKEDTAVREVKEETGIEGEIEKEITPVTYWFVLEGEKIKKTVYYFIMKFVGGDISDHDDEMEEVEWISYNDVSVRLTYPSDKEAWEEAKQLIANS